MSTAGAMSATADEWWASFGDAYDDEGGSSGRVHLEGTEREASRDDGEPSDSVSSPSMELLAEQLSLNGRLTAQLRAKGQLLELEVQAKNRLSEQLASAVGAHASKQADLQEQLKREREAVQALQEALSVSSSEVSRMRMDERARTVALEERQRGLEMQNSALHKRLGELRASETAMQESLKLLAEAAQKAEEEERRKKLAHDSRNEKVPAARHFADPST